jgi:hypothetical protein
LHYLYVILMIFVLNNSKFQFVLISIKQALHTQRPSMQLSLEHQIGQSTIHM